LIHFYKRFIIYLVQPICINLAIARTNLRLDSIKQINKPFPATLVPTEEAR